MILLSDLRYGIRVLWNNPGFSVVAIVALALGIGANTAIFSVVNAVLLGSLPYRGPQTLVRVWEDVSALGFPANTPAPGNYADWKTKIPAFEDVAATTDEDFNLVGEGEPEKLEGKRVTANLFSVLGVKPLLGRVFLPEDGKDANRVVTIGYGLWVRRFGADRSLVGREILLNDAQYTVIGVMPRRFQFPNKETEIWTPMNLTARQLADRGSHYLNVVARLRPGAPLDQANAQLRVLAERLKRDQPDTNRYTGMYAVPVLDDYVGRTKQALLVLFASVGFILLIACANIANLLLARANGRRREIAVRTAVGAGRSRIISQLLTENLLLSLSGGALGLLLAMWSFALLKNLIPDELSAITALSLDSRVMAFTLLVSMLTGLLFGLAPAWQISRIDLTTALKEGSRGSVGSRGGRMRGALVIGEVAITLTLLICATLMMRSFFRLSGQDPGFRSRDVLTLRISLPRKRYADFPKRLDFASRLLDRVRSLPGVKSAGITSALPLVWKGGTNGFWPEGRTPQRGDSRSYDANDRVITPGYLETMGATLVRGRMIEERDGEDAPLVALINEAMARDYWPNEDPIGRRFKMGDPGDGAAWLTIAGILRDMRSMGLDQPARPEMYFPLAQSAGNWMWPRDLVIRTDGNSVGLTNALRQAVWSVDKDQPVSNVATLDEIVDLEIVRQRTQTALLGGFAALALGLACLGIYGVFAYMVTERTPEIGLRMALGADSGKILRQTLARALLLAGSGIAIGLGMSFWATRLLQRLLFELQAQDPGMFLAIAAMLLVVCLLAVSIPALRASRIDPIEALRHE
jgi:putative ABC transport system permease protein